MDWTAAVEKNREALKRVLAMLVAMAGIGERFGFFPQEGRDASRLVPAEIGKLSPALALPRHVRLAVLRLLRPAEAAVRRLVIVMARGLVVPPPRKPGPAIAPKPGAGLAPENPPRRALPLFDPLRPWSGPARPVSGGVPRLSVPGFSAPFPIAVRRPGDPVGAARLALRLDALAAALDDLPGAARRFARWRARAAGGAGAPDKHRDAAGAPKKRRGTSRRLWPLRPGRPPGWRRRPEHEVHEVLNVVHGLAFEVLSTPDTS